MARAKDGAPLSSSLLSSMCEILVHRGPDDQGLYLREEIALGTRRLSIIDLEKGHQPLSNEDQTVWVSHNGEVYNFPELRQELISRGHTFRTRTDTETIVHSYEEWGEDFVHRLRGMFAFALWDEREKKLILVRDRMGIKPLYYTILKDKTVVFGSELKAILVHPEVERSVDPGALDLFLTLEYIPAPYSIFKNIRKLPPGFLLIWQEGRTQLRAYWKIPHQDSPTEKSSKSLLKSRMDELYDLLKESVRLRLISDVPLGVFLSGGIDSSSIVGLMHELGVSPIKTFSIGFQEESYDELVHARRIAHTFNTDHHERLIQPQALELTEKLLYHLDEPIGDFSIFPTYLVSQMARDHVKVILSGDGGDELFAGYEHYQAQKLSGFPVPFVARGILSPLFSLLPPSSKKKGAWNKLRRFAQGFNHHPEDKHFRWMMFLSESDKKYLYSPDLLQELNGTKALHHTPPFQGHFQELQHYDTASRECYLDARTYLADDILVKVDRMSMAASLETRVPLLDHKIVELAFSLPGSLKLKGLSTKWILKKTMERLLPHENIYRSKEGFSIPIKHWLRTELKDLMLDHLSAKRIREEGLFQFEHIQKMMDGHLKKKKNYSHQLWALTVFEIWRDRYL